MSKSQITIKTDLTAAIAEEQTEALAAAKARVKEQLAAKGHSPASAGQLARKVSVLPLATSSDLASMGENHPMDEYEDETTFGDFLARVFERAGSYRQNDYNLAAISFIRSGAKLGDKIEGKLNAALESLSKAAAIAFDTKRDDSNYQTILVASELLMNAATRDLSYAIAQEDKLHAAKLKANVIDDFVAADAWADATAVSGDAEREEVEREAYEGGDDTKHLSDNSVQLWAYVDSLYSILFPYALKADAVRNGWKADYNERPALAYLTVYDGISKETFAAYSVSEALSTLQAQQDRAKEVRKSQTRDAANLAATVW